MPPISDLDTLAELVALNRAVLNADADLDTTAAEQREAAGRRATLRASLAAHDRDQPAEAPPMADELSAALAADPAAANAPDWTDRMMAAEAAAAEARAQWNGRRTIYVQAIGRVDTEIAELDKERSQREKVRSRRWEAFATAARASLCSELIAQYEAFYRDVLGPLDALSPAPAGMVGIAHGSLLALGYADNGNLMHTKKLFPVDDRSIAYAALARFREQLVDEKPAKARAKA